MLISSDNILTPETDETVYVRQVKVEGINDDLIEALNMYLKRRKCAVWVYLAKLETLDRSFIVYEPAHFCLVIKPNDRFNYNRDALTMFELMKQFLDESELGEFVDISVIGHMNTMQFDFNKEEAVEVYSVY